MHDTSEQKKHELRNVRFFSLFVARALQLQIRNLQFSLSLSLKVNLSLVFLFD